MKYFYHEQLLVMKLFQKLLFNLFIGIRRSIYLTLFCFDRVFFRRRQSIIVVSYHSICKDRWKFSIDPDSIKKQIDYLLKHYSVISIKDLESFFQGNKKISFPAVILTFDDGYRDVLVIKKYLQEKNIYPALFVLSDTHHADWKELGTKRKFLNHKEIQLLAKIGWEVGVHSATHANLLKSNSFNLEKEIMQSKKDLERRLQLSLNYFAYPRGKYSSTVVNIVRKAQYLLAFTMDDGFISTKTHKLLIPRIGIDRTHSFHEFKAAFSPSVIALRKLIKSTYIGNYL